MFCMYVENRTTIINYLISYNTNVDSCNFISGYNSDSNLVFSLLKHHLLLKRPQGRIWGDLISERKEVYASNLIRY